MSVVPNKYPQRVQFYENRVTPWTNNSIAIGTNVAKVQNLMTLVQQASARLNEQQTALAAAKAATLAFNLAVESMSVEGASIIKQIRAQAETNGDYVYSIALIPAPATPSPTAPPGTPTALKVTLDGNGALLLNWKCKNPRGTSGTLYQIYRKVGVAGDFKYLGGTGDKKFTDDAVPAGVTQVTYQIQAVRSTAVGLWATFNVFFGSNTGQTTTANVVENAPRIAA